MQPSAVEYYGANGLPLATELTLAWPVALPGKGADKQIERGRENFHFIDF